MPALASFAVLVAAELAIPPLAQRRRHIPWHPGHIAERYGLFTLIVLGESVLASANAVIDATSSIRHLPPLLTMAGCGLALAASMWWVYFARPMRQHMGRAAGAFQFGYLHYVVFSAIGAFSAGIEVMIRHVEEAGNLPSPSEGVAMAFDGTTWLNPVPAAASVAIPVAVFALTVWWLSLRTTLTTLGNTTALTLIALVAISPVLSLGITPAAIGMAALVILLEVAPHTTRLSR
jgi:low temperature requirement protein LtrA